ncbi:MAG: bifunctional nuclease family protein [Puniceicoccales bacterium]|nr:bifunctional nuclease family protein [Puniceicoccales bacterium]
MIPYLNRISFMDCINLTGISVADIIFSKEASSIVMKNDSNGKNFLIHVSIETGSLLLDLFQKRFSMRPNTFTLLSNCITSLGARIQAIIIDDAFDGVFLAKIILRNKGTLSRLDARPSDAIALALVNNLPILATATLVKKLSWIDSLPHSRTPNISFLCH